MPRAHISLRLAPETLNRLQRRATESGVPKTRLAQRYIEEGLRMDAFPGVVYRDGPSGRRAGLAGSRLEVWDVVLTLKHNAGSVADTAEYHSLPEWQIQAVVDFYAEFQAEIDDAIAINRQIEGKAEESWRRSRDLFKASSG